jgi:hypothetical protein
MESSTVALRGKQTDLTHSSTALAVRDSFGVSSSAVRVTAPAAELPDDMATSGRVQPHEFSGRLTRVAPIPDSKDAQAGRTAHDTFPTPWAWPLSHGRSSNQAESGRHEPRLDERKPASYQIGQYAERVDAQ